MPGIPIQGGGGRRRRNVQRGGGNDYTCKPSMCSGNSGISKPDTDFMKMPVWTVWQNLGRTICIMVMIQQI